MTSTPPSPPRSLRPGPDHLCLYILVIGIIGGVLLGPLLRVVNADLYDRLFIGAGDLDRLIQKNNAEMVEKRQTLKASGVSDEAIDEFDHQNQLGQAMLQAKAGDAQLKHYLWMLGRTTALSIAVIFVMVIETLVDPAHQRVRGRLIVARYVLIAGWIALVIAQPRILESFPLLFFGVLVGACLLFALIPLPGNSTPATQTPEPETKT